MMMRRREHMVLGFRAGGLHCPPHSCQSTAPGAGLHHWLRPVPSPVAPPQQNWLSGPCFYHFIHKGWVSVCNALHPCRDLVTNDHPTSDLSHWRHILRWHLYMSDAGNYRSETKMPLKLVLKQKHLSEHETLILWTDFQGLVLWCLQYRITTLF